MADHASEPLETTLRRLKRERDEADVRYNAALTALDETLRPPVDLPQPPSAMDEHQVTALNESWNILPAPPAASGLRRKFTGFIWGVVAPYFQRQLTFNSQVVDHINRQVSASRAAHQASEATTAALREQLAAYAAFQSRLMLYLQQITAYVDTKDRDTAGGALVLNASLSGLAEDIAKRWESLASRVQRYEQRYEARTSSIAASQEELRTMIGVAQLAITTIKREIAPVQPVQGVQEVQQVQSSRDAFALDLDAYKYVGFEDQFRGSREVIRARLESYLPAFEGLTDVLDVGCGRGEFLDLLNARGISGRGIDLNHEMAEVCRARGLDVTEADAVGHLSSLPDASLGGIFAAQVVEHLEPGYLLRFLDLSFQKLRPGGRIVLETLNPACWVAFFESYIRDITHRWPLHPETLKYLVFASGFTRADIEYRSPVPPQDRLQPIAVAAGADPVVADMAEAFNANVEKLNARMFTYMDYAVVGQKSIP